MAPERRWDGLTEEEVRIKKERKNESESESENTIGQKQTNLCR